MVSKIYQKKPLQATSYPSNPKLCTRLSQQIKFLHRPAPGKFGTNAIIFISTVYACDPTWIIFCCRNSYNLTKKKKQKKKLHDLNSMKNGRLTTFFFLILFLWINKIFLNNNNNKFTITITIICMYVCIRKNQKVI